MISAFSRGSANVPFFLGMRLSPEGLGWGDYNKWDDDVGATHPSHQSSCHAMICTCHNARLPGRVAPTIYVLDYVHPHPIIRDWIRCIPIWIANPFRYE